MPYGLNQDVIDRINSIFRNYPEIEKVIIYGSRAKGNYKRGSDIDLTISGESVASSVINKISLELDDLFLPYTIDLSNLNQINNQELLEHIRRVGEPFYIKE